MFKFAKRKNVPEFPLERLLKCYNASGAYVIKCDSRAVGVYVYTYKSLIISLASEWTYIRYDPEEIYCSIENKGFLPDVPDDVRIKTIDIVNEFCEEVERNSGEFTIVEDEEREKAFKEFLEDKCPSQKP